LECHRRNIQTLKRLDVSKEEKVGAKEEAEGERCTHLGAGQPWSRTAGQKPLLLWKDFEGKEDRLEEHDARKV
jgi:hypothetical protein